MQSGRRGRLPTSRPNSRRALHQIHIASQRAQIVLHIVDADGEIVLAAEEAPHPPMPRINDRLVTAQELADRDVFSAKLMRSKLDAAA